ncbi:hypothetical protein DPMN_088129 [Dreissena polymorpha]|uniref:Uncharacterized protein n=1 Tax=Dreissena polymorpha TaxID=45954 RepID=A0A9D4KUH4_DREPO|nr:hypothetical protein DPMN_088129 [Dreissena polymorpha]
MRRVVLSWQNAGRPGNNGGLHTISQRTQLRRARRSQVSRWQRPCVPLVLLTQEMQSPGVPSLIFRGNANAMCAPSLIDPGNANTMCAPSLIDPGDAKALCAPSI